MEYSVIIPIEELQLASMFKENERISLYCRICGGISPNPAARARVHAVLDNKLAKIATRVTETIELVSCRRMLIGAARNIPVHVLEPRLPLLELHRKILASVSATRSVRYDRRKNGNRYVPRVTDMDDEFVPGSRFTATKMALIECDANTVLCVGIYPFGGVHGHH